VDLLVDRPAGEAITAVGRRVRDGLAAAATGPVSTAHLVDAEVALLRWFGRTFGMEGWMTLMVATLGRSW
jgi:hypothetical protein